MVQTLEQAGVASEIDHSVVSFVWVDFDVFTQFCPSQELFWNRDLCLNVEKELVS